LSLLNDLGFANWRFVISTVDHISTLNSTVTNLITTTTKAFTCGNSQVDGFYYANIQLTSGEMSKCISATIIESDSNHYATLQLIENSAIVRVWGKVSGQQGQVRLVFKN
jgi:hypothetical protein